MDINVIRGLATLFLMIAFLALVFWVYGKKRKPYFDKAARLALEDDTQESKHHE